MTTPQLCTLSAARRLQEIGLMVRTEDRFVGYSNFKLNYGLIEVLKDILFPRDESGFAPFFQRDLNRSYPRSTKKTESIRPCNDAPSAGLRSERIVYASSLFHVLTTNRWNRERKEGSGVSSWSWDAEKQGNRQAHRDERFPTPQPENVEARRRTRDAFQLRRRSSVAFR